MAAATQDTEYLDVLIIGAGLSGIGMACHLQMETPGKSFAILERREALGGTWDLFRYPGIRSDSDMFTFGYKFRPWNETRVLADGTSIRNYVQDTAREYNVEDKIRYGLKTTAADWSSTDACWTVTAEYEASGETRQIRCGYLIMCTGYYNYDKGYMPEFPGMEDFGGQVIHPQKWPEDLDYTGKRVLIIGSGATAITLVPAMAKDAAHVTMLQRSPTYIMPLPAYDKLSGLLERFLPSDWVFTAARQRNITMQRAIYKLSQRYPNMIRRWMKGVMRKQIGNDIDMRHFSPKYNPWDERLCVVPNADFFRSLRHGEASIVTDHIESFTESGIRLQSGETLEADIIISATGLNLQVLGGARFSVDGQQRSPSDVMLYKGTLIEDAPNLAAIIGYINASWTLKADIAAGYVCRLLRHMDARGYAVATPRDGENCVEQDTTVMGALNAGYVQRAKDVLPRQGSKLPWRVLNDFRRDKPMLLRDPVEDGVLHFDDMVGPDKRQAA